MTETIKEKVMQIAAAAARDEGIELVDVEVKGSSRRPIIRVTVDKENGITIGECEKLSRAIEALMDVEDPVSGPYMLEVSSPGIDRPLKNSADFIKSIGKLARVITADKINEQTFFLGRIVDAAEGWIRLKPEDKAKKRPASSRKETDNSVIIPLEKITKAKLEIEINKK
ncbi:MAG: ribosome maturation factor RimP [Dissulfurispiraceae bacterium]|jgi:ribosome maturation factor RimP|nr:ribosome maturation factor RimP [Dissulfurispiraceae bacterium]